MVNNLRAWPDFNSVDSVLRSLFFSDGEKSPFSTYTILEKYKYYVPREVIEARYE